MDKNLTAVEWLVEKINEQKAWANPQQLNPLIEQAKEMEKEKLKDSWVEGSIKWGTNRTFEQYYNETYGGNK
jgi:hypothetical protein